MKIPFACALLLLGLLTGCATPLSSAVAEANKKLEQCVPGMPGKVLVTLYLGDSAMFDEGYDADARW